MRAIAPLARFLRAEVGLDPQTQGWPERRRHRALHALWWTCIRNQGDEVAQHRRSRGDGHGRAARCARRDLLACRIFHRAYDLAARSTLERGTPIVAASRAAGIWMRRGAPERS
jgi:hypothetical protein